MPFTPTHILAILPIFYINRRLPLSALAIGAMIPDFPMFFPISTYSFSHSFLGVVSYCVPMALLVYFLFEHIGKQFVIDISPEWMRSRLGSYREEKPILSPINVVVLSSACAIGSVSHIVWDAFTHKWGWAVELYPYLEQQFSLFGFSLPYYKSIQYGSTIFGLPLLAILGVLYIYGFKPLPVKKKYRFSKASIWMIVISFLVIPVLVAAYHWQHESTNVSTILGYTIKESIGVGITLFFLYSLLHWWRNRAFYKNS